MSTKRQKLIAEALCVNYFRCRNARGHAGTATMRGREERPAERLE
ncbi:MAG: hypothetical protein ABW250_14220 [Pyrinomonadaceae bacterium]